MATEESSSDSSDSESVRSEPEVPEEPPSSWASYSWYLVRKASKKTWSAIHVFGEKLAWALGITSPDWQYALDIHEDLLREEREEEELEEKALKRQQELITQRLSDLESSRTEGSQLITLTTD